MNTARLFLSCLLVGLVLAGSGCSKKISKTQGRVTLDGVPVAGAMVSLVPTDDQGQPASGFTDNDGKFSLMTFKPDDGAVPGSYKVTVTKNDAPKPEGEFSPDMDPKKMGEMMKKMAGGPNPGGRGTAEKNKKKSSLPGVYGELGTTPLKVTIPTDGDLDLPLKANVGQ